MNGITNIFIESVLSTRSKYFKGVFSANSIDPLLKNQNCFSIICNLDNLGNKGTHFISIICFPRFVIYIDPLGFPCTVETINIFLKTLNKPIYFNLTQIQSINSKFCGFFGILFVLHFDLIFDGKKYKNIVFNTTNLIENDNICITEIKRILNYFMLLNLITKLFLKQGTFISFYICIYKHL